MTTLFHTSPAKIEEINEFGLFGSFLFFACEPYKMTASKTVFTYSIEVDDDAIINAGRLFYHDDAEKLSVLIAEVVSRYDVSEADAEALIEESASIYEVESSVEPEDLAEAEWDIQHITAKAARALGFRAVRVTDEQGSSVMIDMLGRESELLEIA